VKVDGYWKSHSMCMRLTRSSRPSFCTTAASPERTRRWFCERPRYACRAPTPPVGHHGLGACGRFLSDRLPPFRRIDARVATERLVGMLFEIGFEPEAVTAGRRRRILLHHCPFREAAEAHREVVCSVHLGLMQGLLAGIDAPVDAERLEPFVQPDLCVAHLVSRRR
jgi:hypothetical protein